MAATSKLSLTLSMARKDWRLFWTDRRAALLCFAVPVLLASAFGVIFHKPQQDGAGARLPVVVVVEDDGAFTRQVAAELLASPRFEAKELTRAEAEAAVAQRRPAVAVVLPAGFERLKDWTPGAAAERPRLALLHHPGSRAELQWAEGVITEVVMKQLASGALPLLRGEGALAPPFEVEAAAISSHPRAHFNSYSHSFCGMTLQYLLFWGMESGLLLLRERQRGVWVRVRAAAVPLSCVIGGKALTTAFIALLQVLVTFAVGYLAFGVTIDGSVIGFALLAVAACVLAASTGLLVAAVGGTEARARSVSIVVILGVSMLGGLWVPAFLLPPWVRDAAQVLPTTWAMRGLEAVTWQRAGLLAVLPSVGVVAGFAAALLAVAALRLKFAERRIRQGNA
jgi:ABC-2 type transport system permease protein